MVRNVAVILAGALLLAGCSMSPKLELKPVEIPLALAKEAKTMEVINVEWWREFKDPLLEELIKEALVHNSDLRVAVTNVSLARATLGGARADLYPSFDAEGSAGRKKTSDESYPVGTRATYNNFSLSGVLSYEIDLWGRLRDSKRSAEALLLANEANQETIALAVASSVAEGYFNLITLREGIQILKETVDSYQKSYDYRLKQHGLGAISEIVMEQSRVELESAKANLYLYERQESEAATALSILLGRTPKEIFEKSFSLASVLPALPEVPAGLPSEILTHRSDIKVAEEKLKAANYSIGVARAAYFPTLSLSGVLGYQSAELDRLMRPSGEMWSLGGNLGAPLLNFGRTSAKVESAKAQKESAEIEYEATIRQAFGEVKDALVKREVANKRLLSLQSQITSQNRVLEIAQKRFDEGYFSHLDLLDAQRGYLNARLALNSAKLEAATSVVTLYKALGGGWKIPQEETK